MNRFSEAVRLHQSGRQHEAEVLCQELLQRDPGNVQVLALFGTIKALLGCRDEAIASFERAAARQSGHAPIHYMLGNLYREAGQLDKAVTNFRKAIACQPGFAEAFNNLGLTLGELGRYDEELDCYQQSLALNSRNSLAWYNLGNSLQRLKRFDDAVTCYQQSLQLKPDDVNALFNMGNACMAAGRLSAAIDSYEVVIRRNPNHAAALSNLGVVLRRSGHLEPALDALSRVTTIEPDNVLARISLGNVQADLGRLADAATTLKQATALAPDFADVFFNLGNILHCSKQYAEAVSALETACHIQPDNCLYLGSLIGCRMSLWQMPAAEGAWQHLLSHWRDGQKAPVDVVLERSDDLQLVHQCAARHARQTLQDCDPQWLQPGVVASGDTRSGRRRIGYLSPDFGNHPVGMSMVEVFERHDRLQFEVIALALKEHPTGQIRDRIVQACDRYVSLDGLSVNAAIDSVRELNLDLLIDLAGYTADSRPHVLAARPARVQAAYLGYAATSASDWIDYLIADRYVVPMACAGQYSERIAWLDTCFFPTDTTLNIPAPSTDRKQEGLPCDALVFCCFNNPRRISTAVMTVWMELLSEVANSVLWLGHASSVVANNIWQFVARCGIDTQRVVFANFSDTRMQHLARHRLADLYLDTFPYNSHSTARDALFAGLPVVTCSGNVFASRIAGSLLNTLGLESLIAADLVEYRNKALKLAGDRPALNSVRNRLSKALSDSDLFNTSLLTRNLEAAYRAMLWRHDNGLVPEAFMLSADKVEWLSPDSIEESSIAMSSS